LKLHLVPSIALAVLCALTMAVEPASAAKPVAYEYSFPVSFVQPIQGVDIEFSGIISISSRVVGQGAQTRHRATMRYHFVSEDGTIRATGLVAHRLADSAHESASQYHYNYRLLLLEKGRGVVARVGLHTHTVYNAKGELVVYRSVLLP
jgi:hypothetical protein